MTSGSWLAEPRWSNRQTSEQRWYSRLSPPLTSYYQDSSSKVACCSIYFITTKINTVNHEERLSQDCQTCVNRATIYYPLFEYSSFDRSTQKFSSVIHLRKPTKSLPSYLATFVRRKPLLSLPHPYSGENFGCFPWISRSVILGSAKSKHLGLTNS